MSIDKDALEKASDEVWNSDADETALRVARRCIEAYLATMQAKGWEMKPKMPTAEMTVSGSAVKLGAYRASGVGAALIWAAMYDTAERGEK